MPSVGPTLRGWLVGVLMAGALLTFAGDAASQVAAPPAPVASSPANAAQPSSVSPSAVAAPATQAVPAAASEKIILSLDRDLVNFTKAAAWVFGIFITVFAFIAVGFFGWDVKQTRKAMYDARDDLQKRMEEIRKDHKELDELKERLKKLGAELIDVAEKNAPAETGAPTPAPPASLSTSTLPTSDTDDELRGDELRWGPLKNWTDDQRRSYLRNVIGTSEFEWSTLGTLSRKTGLPEADIWNLFANDPFVERTTGRDGRLLLRIRSVNAMGSATLRNPKIGRAFRTFLWDAPAKPDQKASDEMSPKDYDRTLDR